MQYSGTPDEEKLLSKEEAEKLGKRHEKTDKKHEKDAPDIADLKKDAEKIGGSIISVLSNIGSKDKKYPSLDNDTANNLINSAKELATDKDKQQKIVDGAKKLGEKAKDVAHYAKEAVKGEFDVDLFTTDALALLFLFLETLPPLIFLVLNKVFLILSIVLSFFVLIAVGVYIVCYIIIKKYKESLRDSTAAIILEIVLSITEGILIVTFSIVGEEAFIAAYVILAVSLLCASIFADHLKNKYTYTNGCRIAFIMAVNTVFVLFNVLGTNIIECIVAAVVSFLYLMFAIRNLNEIVKESKEENSKKAASFATLIVYERKLEFGCIVVMWLVRWCKEMNENRKKMAEENAAKVPLLDKSEKKEEKKEEKKHDGEKKSEKKAESEKKPAGDPSDPKHPKNH